MSRELGNIELFYFRLLVVFVFKLQVSLLFLTLCNSTSAWRPVYDSSSVDSKCHSVLSWISWVTFEESLVTSFQIFQDLYGISPSLP